MFRSRVLSQVLTSTWLVSLAAASSGCGIDLPDPDTVEQVVLRISVVPSEVRCIRITVLGTGRTVTRELEATGGISFQQSFTGLPLGLVTFTGEAFPAACSSVTKSTVPAWVSETVPVSIVLGRIANVDLTMVRNGRAKVSLGFSDEPACSAAGAACLSATECCSRACVARRCAAPDGGALADAQSP
jgi:hypothetical protein